MKREIDRCIEFLEANGWKYDERLCENGAFWRGSLIVVEFDPQDDNIIFLDSQGDCGHVPLNYYALLGFLLEHRQITTSYVSVGL